MASKVPPLCMSASQYCRFPSQVQGQPAKLNRTRDPVASHVFLESWTVDIHQEGCNLRSAPQKRHTAHLRLVLLWHTQETEQLGPGR